ncbi:MAG: hypothetical protein RL757_2007, partial [Bacteroidota bacterium]
AGGTPRSSGTAYTYAWNDNTGQTDSVAINLRAGAYVVSVTDANGCIDSARTVVGEPASGVQAAAVQTFTGCFGTATGRATVTAQGGTQPYTYSWSSGSILQEARDLLGIPYTVTVTDQNGCSFLDTVDVQTLDSISIYQSAIKPSCFGFSNGTITIDSVLGGAGNNVLRNYNFRWSSTPVQTTPQATGLLGGRAYTVTVTDGNGCFNYTSMVLDQPGQILVATTPTNNKCFGDTTGIAQVNAQGSINVFTYQWSANVPNDRTLPRVTGLTAGIYTVTVTDSTGCTANTSVTVTQPSRLRLVDKISDNNKCFGDSVGSAQIRMAGGTPQYKYIWSTAAPRLDTLPTIAGLKAGTYTITVSDINGCRFIDTVGLREPNLLAGNITTQPVKCFAGRDGSISINPLGGTPPYVFSTDNRLFTGTNNLVGLRSATYDLYVKDANNCLWFSRASVGTPTQFTVNAGPDVTIRLGESTQLTATPSNNQGRTSFIWRAPYDSTLSCTRCATPVSKPFFTINYVVTATDTTGCIATDEVQVTVLKNGEIFIPTGFSPNADGANDKLRVRGKEGIKIKSYKIYDRWGELIYEARNFMINDENAAWDGTFRGQPMNQGAFVWFVEAQFIDGSVETFKGNTTLLR